MHASLTRASVGLLTLFLLFAGTVHAQTAPDAAPAAQSAPVFKPEEIDQMVAPIALYPDTLLVQILMAATYPLEVVQAERWVRDPKNAKLKGDQLAAALQNQAWDPSVKSLVPFPQVLEMMSDKLDWTQRLGDAVLAQNKDVMDSVQRLRQQAEAAGNLKSTPQQTVVIQEKVIVIQPASPQIVYVPVYNPTIVYGAWPYPTYPPVYYPPPPAYYPVGSALIAGMAFATGVAIVDSLWGCGNANWRGSSITVNQTTYNTINRTNINAGRATTLPASAGGNWQHQPAHRGGVAYRGTATQQTYQRPNATPASATQNFRGYDNAARPSQGAGQTAARPAQGGGQAATRPSQAATRPATGAAAGGQARPATGAAAAGQARPTTGAANRAAAQPARAPASANARPSAFTETGNGRDVNAQSARGQASRQTATPRAAASGGGRTRSR